MLPQVPLPRYLVCLLLLIGVRAAVMVGGGWYIWSRSHIIAAALFHLLLLLAVLSLTGCCEVFPQ
jgi:hypothetical protein